MTRELTCIICPRGCQLTVTLEGGKVKEVKGNACPRGVAYAESECTNPMRTVTTTVRCEDGAVVPVKTDRPIPKGKMFDVMREVNATVAKCDLKIGDIVIDGVAGTDANIVVTDKKE